MEFSLNARVYCSDGAIGKTVRAVINPVTKAVTHFTVRPEGMAESEHVVPIEDVSASTSDSVTLSVSKNQFYLYSLFISHRFIDMEESDVALEDIATLPEAHRAMDHVFWPFVTAEGHLGAYADVKQIPADELAIYRGAPVEATDGHVGDVSELVINPQNVHVTHVLLRKGHLFGHKDIAVPVPQVDRIDEGIVYLKLDKAAVDALPELAIKRK
jgi:uncharacterized protein YrrD